MMVAGIMVKWILFILYKKVRQIIWQTGFENDFGKVMKKAIPVKVNWMGEKLRVFLLKNVISLWLSSQQQVIFTPYAKGKTTPNRDPVKDAQRRLDYVGHYAANQLERLAESVVNVLSDAQVTLSFYIDHKN